MMDILKKKLLQNEVLFAFSFINIIYELHVTELNTSYYNNECETIKHSLFKQYNYQNSFTETSFQIVHLMNRILNLYGFYDFWEICC